MDRINSFGFCGKGNNIEIAKIIENFNFEEPCLSKNGLVAVFFSGCNLRCNYCQNYEISRDYLGQKYTPEAFADILIKFDQMDIDGFDFITPTLYSELLLQALEIYQPKHKIIYNTSGYENLETFDKLCSHIDILLTDFKYYDDKLAEKLSACKNYKDTVVSVIKIFDKHKKNIMMGDILEQGRIIRHLILPGFIKDSFNVLDEIANIDHNSIVSLMCQYTPTPNASIKRKISILEYKAVVEHFFKVKLKNGYLQDFSSADEKFIPKF